MLNKKYTIVLIITIMLVILSTSISWLNYSVSLNNAHKQLKEHSLPLSLDNIYSSIQKNIIEPYLLSSMMANDTFVQDWILNEEKDKEKIIKYLESIKNKYGMFNTFLVSEKTKNYYTQDGFVEVIKKDNLANKWYFDFKRQQEHHEINLDFNNHLSNDLIMFINYKIFDAQYHFIGATGVALKISYINDMLQKFRQKHNFIVTFFNKKGDVVLAEREITQEKNIQELPYLKFFQDKIISKTPQLLEYQKKDAEYILNTKYIPELNLYLAVEVKVNKYIEDVKKVFYFNLIISMIITLLVAVVLIMIIKKHNSKYETLAKYDPLTKVLNRRSFEEQLTKLINTSKNKKFDFSLIFVDIDNFKLINDSLGHSKGDVVLCEITKILKENIREIDLIARWGGEEFIVVLKNTPLETGKIKAELLRQSLEENIVLKDSINYPITGSFGLTQFKAEDSLDSLISRADEAMYKSKTNGKNQVTVAK